jgi:putative N6-adenine-specific DNA methylase
MSNKYRLVCPCHFGLESILSYEIKKIGGENIVNDNGRVSFDGDETIIARANINLYTAERVLIELDEFYAYSFEELFQGVRKLPLENFIGKSDAFPVKGFSLNSKLFSVRDCQSIIKKAAVERLKEKYSVHWLEETGPVYQLQFGIMKDLVSIYLDTSGAGLHKRGYRQNSSNAAPIKETLAAGIVDLARVREDSQVCDPFCGSGTFLIESALKALNIAPGLNRRFSADKWRFIDKRVWDEEKTNAIANVRKTTSFSAIGFDISPECVELTQENIRKAGVSSKIKIEKADVNDFKNLNEYIVFSNPPYGERLLEKAEAENLYSVMGEKFLKCNNKYYIISPHEQFEQLFGKTADKRRKLYNGMIKCQLYMYYK